MNLGTVASVMLFFCVLATSGGTSATIAAVCTQADPDRDRDGYCASVDCDDRHPNIHPGARENCSDKRDNDCDGQVDGADFNCSCPDADRDGYADAVCGGTDCNDRNKFVQPGAVEDCFDRKDNDCDGQTDGEDTNCGAPCADADLDGHADASCGGTDCNDANPSTYPGSPEICSDGEDNDCNGLVDGADPICNTCADVDGDGYQDSSCGGPDCNDFDPSINPGVFENCFNGTDDNCDGVDDAADPNCGFGCPDNDFDGFNDVSCGGSDCDDLNREVYPGALENCSNGIDDDCNGNADSSDTSCACADADGDGAEDRGCGGSDCDDSDPAVNPFTQEVCDDGIDNDCDGLVDAEDSDCAGA